MQAADLAGVWVEEGEPRVDLDANAPRASATFAKAISTRGSRCSATSQLFCESGPQPPSHVGLFCIAAGRPIFEVIRLIDCSTAERDVVRAHLLEGEKSDSMTAPEAMQPQRQKPAAGT
ncbi:hypothetical protein B1790_09390 [Mycobacterium sp. AT1]|nr:hypothetical protein B1790_09390 [Mycobacterium sp. AT1]